MKKVSPSLNLWEIQNSPKLFKLNIGKSFFSMIVTIPLLRRPTLVSHRLDSLLLPPPPPPLYSSSRRRRLCSANRRKHIATKRNLCFPAFVETMILLCYYCSVTNRRSLGVKLTVEVLVVCDALFSTFYSFSFPVCQPRGRKYPCEGDADAAFLIQFLTDTRVSRKIKVDHKFKIEINPAFRLLGKRYPFKVSKFDSFAFIACVARSERESY